LQSSGYYTLGYVVGRSAADVAYFFKHPLIALQAQGIVDKTAAEVYNLAAAGKIPGGVRGNHNGPADAVRHAAGICRLAREFGTETAREIGDVHENDPKEPVGEKKMDLKNNSVGRGLAGKSGDCLDNALDTLNEGGLQTSTDAP